MVGSFEINVRTGKPWVDPKSNADLSFEAYDPAQVAEHLKLSKGAAIKLAEYYKDSINASNGGANLEVSRFFEAVAEHCTR